MLRIGHAISLYLARSATFVYTQICAQRDPQFALDPVVLAMRTAHLDEFAVGSLQPLAPPTTRLASSARRARAWSRGVPTTYGERLLHAARAQRVDVLHAHWGDMGWTALPAARRLGLPLITTFYGYDVELPQRPGWQRRMNQLFARGDAFCCEGPFMAQRLIAAGAPADRVHLVPIGLDLSKFTFAPTPRAPGEPLRIVQGARFEEKKGFETSLRAFAAARPQLGEDAILDLVGDGPLRRPMEQLAAELGIGEAVRFHGMLAHPQFREIVGRAHLALQPSCTAADGETEGGAPTAILELQALGVPVLATRHADIPFISEDPDRLVPERDAAALAARITQYAAMDDAARLQLAATARARVEGDHDSRAIARKLELLYQESRAAYIR